MSGIKIQKAMCGYCEYFLASEVYRGEKIIKRKCQYTTSDGGMVEFSSEACESFKLNVYFDCLQNGQRQRILIPICTLRRKYGICPKKCKQYIKEVLPAMEFGKKSSRKLKG